jgi:hypothetical protein
VGVAPSATRDVGREGEERRFDRWIAVAHRLLCGAAMRLTPALLLLTLLTTTPVAHAAKGPAPIAASAAASHIEFEIAELGKDGARRSTTLTLALNDRGGGSPSSELRTHVRVSERENSYYWARVAPESTAAGTRYSIDLQRSEDSSLRHPDIQLGVHRVLPTGTPTQLSRVLRPDGSALIVTVVPR